jgi:hypothetical protein
MTNPELEDKAELQKHTLNLRAGDFDKLKALFPKMSAAKFIRDLVSRVIDNAEAEAAANAPTLDIDTDEVLK